MNILIDLLSFNTVMYPSRFGWLCRKKPKLIAACKSVVKTISLLFTRYTRFVCSACGTEVKLYVNRRVLYCPAYQGKVIQPYATFYCSYCCKDGM